MPRPDIAMNAADIADFIDRTTTTVLAVVDAGSFVARRLPSARAGTTIVLESVADQKLWTAIENDSRASMTFDEFISYSQLRYVTIHGSACLGPLNGDRRQITMPLTGDVTAVDFAKAVDTP